MEIIISLDNLFSKVLEIIFKKYSHFDSQVILLVCIAKVSTPWPGHLFKEKVAAAHRSCMYLDSAMKSEQELKKLTLITGLVVDSRFFERQKTSVSILF